MRRSRQGGGGDRRSTVESSVARAHRSRFRAPKHFYSRGHRPVTLRQIYVSTAMFLTVVWCVYVSKQKDAVYRKAKYFAHSRNVHLHDNAQNLLPCYLNPLLPLPKRPELEGAHRSLYPFPRYSATCRGHDDKLPEDYLLTDLDVSLKWKEAYFKGTRGLLEWVLMATWDYRFDYKRALFREDRRAVNAIPARDESAATDLDEEEKMVAEVAARRRQGGTTSAHRLRVVHWARSRYIGWKKHARGMPSFIAFSAPPPLPPPPPPAAEWPEQAPPPPIGQDLMSVQGGGALLFGFDLDQEGNVGGSRCSCSPDLIEHAVLLDPNPTAAGSAFLVPHAQEDRPQPPATKLRYSFGAEGDGAADTEIGDQSEGGIPVDALQVAMCFVRELHYADVRLTLDSSNVVVDPVRGPSGGSGGGGGRRGGESSSGEGALSESERARRRFINRHGRLHFGIWPVDEVMDSAEVAHAQTSLLYRLVAPLRRSWAKMATFGTSSSLSSSSSKSSSSSSFSSSSSTSAAADEMAEATGEPEQGGEYLDGGRAGGFVESLLRRDDKRRRRKKRMGAGASLLSEARAARHWSPHHSSDPDGHVEQERRPPAARMLPIDAASKAPIISPPTVAAAHSDFGGGDESTFSLEEPGSALRQVPLSSSLSAFMRLGRKQSGNGIDAKDDGDDVGARSSGSSGLSPGRVQVFAVETFAAGARPDRGIGGGGDESGDGAAALAFRVSAATASLAPAAIAHCTRVIANRGLAYSLLLGNQWAYLWPRVPHVLTAEEAATQGTLPVPDAAALAGVIVVDSPEQVLAVTAAEIEGHLAAVAPPEHDLELIRKACAEGPPSAAPDFF